MIEYLADGGPHEDAKDLIKIFERHSLKWYFDEIDETARAFRDVALRVERDTKTEIQRLFDDYCESSGHAEKSCQISCYEIGEILKANALEQSTPE